jgi:hypothetical protein
MTHSKKILPSLLAVALLSSGIALAMPAAAFATVGGLSVDSAVISNGQAQTVHFGSYAGAIPEGTSSFGSEQVLCFFMDGMREVNYAYGFGDFVPVTDTVRDGELSDTLNSNGSGSGRTFEWAVFTISYGDINYHATCSDLPQARADIEASSSAFYSSAVIEDSVSWTILPSLTTPITQTLYVGQKNTTPATYTASYAELILDPVAGSLWMNQTMYPCDETDSGDMTALPAGLTMDEETNSPAGTLAPLLISGTPAAGTQGTYRLCLTLGGDGGYVAGFFDLTIADAPVAPVALAETGVDMRPLMITGFAGLGLFVIGALGMSLRRRALKK